MTHTIFRDWRKFGSIAKPKPPYMENGMASRLQLLTDERIITTPAWNYTFEAEVELRRAGITHPNDPACAEHDSRVIYVADREDRTKVRGLLAWELVEWSSCAHVRLGWVHLDFRKLKVYTDLWNYLLWDLRQNHPSVKRVTSGVSVNNSTSKKMHRALGRQETLTMFEFKL